MKTCPECQAKTATLQLRRSDGWVAYSCAAHEQAVRQSIRVGKNKHHDEFEIVTTQIEYGS